MAIFDPFDYFLHYYNRKKFLLPRRFRDFYVIKFN